MKEELKRCPFCGSTKIELTHKGNAYTKTRSVTIKCKGCMVKRTTGAIRYTLEWCEEKAINAWNTRQEESVCPGCAGTGGEIVIEDKGSQEEFTHGEPCSTCHGTGRVKSRLEEIEEEEK